MRIIGLCPPFFRIGTVAKGDRLCEAQPRRGERSESTWSPRGSAAALKAVCKPARCSLKGAPRSTKNWGRSAAPKPLLGGNNDGDLLNPPRSQQKPPQTAVALTRPLTKPHRRCSVCLGIRRICVSLRCHREIVTTRIFDIAQGSVASTRELRGICMEMVRQRLPVSSNDRHRCIPRDVYLGLGSDLR